MQEPIILKKLNEVYFQVSAETGTHLELREHMSCYAPNFKFNPKYKCKMWNGKIYFYDIRNHLFPIGLMPEVYKFAAKFNYTVKFDFDVSCLSKEVTDEFLEEFSDAVSEGTTYDVRDYQFETIKTAIQNKRGILLSATGSGKSYSIYMIFRYLLAKGKKKMMLIVPNTSLVEQMFTDFIDYGWTGINNYVSKLYSGKKPDYSKPLLITTWQSIYKQDDEFFKDFDSVIIDECLHPDSLIHTPKGMVKISDLNIGDKIFSYNEETKTTVEDEIVDVYKNMINSLSEDMFEITLENGDSIKITGNHKVMTQNGWKAVKYLCENDEILNLNDL